MKRKKYEHRRQHFVPACYLKAWLDPSAPKTSSHTPYVWLFDKDGQNPKAKSPEKIFRESDMYTITVNGGRDLRLEHGLGTLESNFTRVRTSKFNLMRPLTDEDWLWACLFTATAHNRTASNRNHFLGQMETVKAMFEKVAGPDWESRTFEPGPLPPHVDRSKVYIPQPGDFDNLKETTTTILLESAVKVILPALLGMHKAVLCTNDPLGFLTSDAPSTWCDPTAYRRHPYERAVGLRNPAIEITLPISPEQCLLFTHRSVGPTYIQLSTDWVDALNHRHAAFAPSTVVARSKETRARWFKVGEPPPDSWEALHPDPEDRHRWTSPDCPPELRDIVRK